MNSWMLNLGICLALLLGAYTFLQSERPWLRRIGVWLIFASIGAAAWFITDSWVVVAVSLLCWFIIPVVQAAYLSRTLRFSRESALTPGTLQEQDLEELRIITGELRELDFVLDRDYWLEPSPVRHGFRLFQHREKPVYAAISVIRQGQFSLLFLQFVTIDEQGNYWITWDFPLSYNMKMPPELQVYRCLEAHDSAELFSQHEEYLRLNEVHPHNGEQLPEAPQFFNRINEAMIRYNLHIGMLRHYPQASGQIGYSWRGTWYLSRKVLWEMVAG
ncbi:MAG: hypothetical protein LBH01_04995 [Verrucomicrobiales bacterium]|jgi:hypothetical protein|nr:hypothetical protein [Verrucomicrobiales bacterium]